MAIVNNKTNTCGSTKTVSHYLHPDYLDPLPFSSTADQKLSPLALLAQTCNNIGKEATITTVCHSPRDVNSNNRPNSHHNLTSSSSTSINATSKSCASSPSLTPSMSLLTNRRPAGSPMEADKQPTSTSCTSECENPSSTCTVESGKSKSFVSNNRVSRHNQASSGGAVEKRSLPDSSKQCSQSSATTPPVNETVARLSPTTGSALSTTDCIVNGIAKTTAHNLFQLKSSGFFPELAHQAAFQPINHKNNASIAAMAIASAAAFGLPCSTAPNYGHYSAAAGLAWPSAYLPPSSQSTAYDSQNGQPTNHHQHQSGSSNCTCSHCSLHAKSMAEYYYALLQTAGVLPPPLSKSNVEFCMYCGKHCPTLEELITHVRSHDSMPTPTPLSTIPAPYFGLYPSSSPLSPDTLHKAWSYASIASRYHPYRNLLAGRLPHGPSASVIPSHFGAPLV